MSWFDSSGWANMAKTALSTAQKTIDQALDINDSTPSTTFSHSLGKKLKDDSDKDLFAAFGVGNFLSNASSTFKSKVNESESTSKDEGPDHNSWNEWGKEDDNVQEEPVIDIKESGQSQSSSLKKKGNQSQREATSVDVTAGENVSSCEVVITDNTGDTLEPSHPSGSEKLSSAVDFTTSEGKHHNLKSDPVLSTVSESSDNSSILPESLLGNVEATTCESENIINDIADVDEGSSKDENTLSLLEPDTGCSNVPDRDPLSLNVLSDFGEVKGWDVDCEESESWDDLNNLTLSLIQSENQDVDDAKEEVSPFVDQSNSKLDSDVIIDTGESETVPNANIDSTEFNAEIVHSPVADYICTEVEAVYNVDLPDASCQSDFSLTNVEGTVEKTNIINEASDKLSGQSVLSEEIQNCPPVIPDVNLIQGNIASDDSVRNVTNDKNKESVFVAESENEIIDVVEEESSNNNVKSSELNIEIVNHEYSDRSSEEQLSVVAVSLITPDTNKENLEQHVVCANKDLKIKNLVTENSNDETSSIQDGVKICDNRTLDIGNSNDVSGGKFEACKMTSDKLSSGQDDKQAPETSADENEIQTSSETLVLSEEDSFETLNNPSLCSEEITDESVTPVHSADLVSIQNQSSPVDESSVSNANIHLDISDKVSHNITLISPVFQEESDLNSQSNDVIFQSSTESKESETLSDDYTKVGSEGSGERINYNSAEDGDHRSDRSNSSSSSLSSFVKFTNSEDDMQKACYTPPSQSSSDILKIDVDMMSGHTSGDELETTTSSDIEIISSPNGGSNTSGRDSRASSSPGKNVSNLITSSLMEKESQTKGSFKGSIDKCDEKVEGDVACTINNCMTKPSKTSCRDYPPKFNLTRQGMRKRTTSETSSEDAEMTQPSPAFIKKMSDMAAVIDAREAKLVDMSKENIKLKENNMEITENYDQLKLRHSVCQSEIKTISANMQEKLASTEKRLQQALQEKVELDKRLQLAKKEVNQRLRPEEIQGALQEKEQQIQELLLEGEKLSKQQLQHSNIIKKLRAKEKESEETIKNTKESLQAKLQELEVLKTARNDRNDSEKKLTDNIKQLSGTIQLLEKELAQSQSDLEDTNERNKGLKFSLENSCKEIAELKKLNAAAKTEAEEASLSAEMVMKEQLRLTLDQVEKDSKNECNSLLSQIEEFQLCIARTEKKANHREELLRQEISNLQERLQITECRNDEVSQNISAATRPLLRQIENLQSTFAAQSQSYEVVEKNLTDRLVEAQRQLAVANEKEKIATERYMAISSHSSSIESQNASLLREKTVLTSALEAEKSKLKNLQEIEASAASQIEDIRCTYIDEISILKRSKTESDLEMALLREKYEAERKAVQFLQEQLEREKNASIILSESSNYSSGANTPVSMSRMSSVGENPWIQEDVLNQSLMSFNMSQPNKMSVYETLRSGNNASSLIENLQSQLKQREGEIIHLQNDMSNMDRIRESMAQELVRLSSHNDKIMNELENLQELQKKFKSMESEYNALLQMYGEKVEEAQELRMDLQDVKDMYRIQIDQLLQQKI